MKKIIVDRITPFSFPKEIIAKYGTFKICQQDKIAAKVLEFTIDDIMFFDAPYDNMTKASKFQKMVTEAGYVPLDIYCARAIYENREAIFDLGYCWHESEIKAVNCSLDSIMFLGNIVSRDDNDVDHFPFFKYGAYSGKMAFKPIEDDPFFIKNKDFILVFKKEFIESL